MSTRSTIEDYADLRAELDAGRDRDEVLRRAKLTVPQWVALQRRWLRTLALEADRGDATLAQRYARRLREQTNTPSPLDPPTSSASDLATAPPRVAPPPSPTASPWASMPPPSPAPPPFAEAAPPPLVPPVPAPPRDSDVAPPPSKANETQVVAAVDVGPATPFEGSDPDPPSRAIDETAAISGPIITGLAALPFDPNAPTRLPPTNHDAIAAGAAIAGGTAAAVDAVSDLELAQISPSAAMTLRRYAALSAELAVAGGPREAALGRYGLDERGFLETKAKFNRRFAEQPSLYGHYRREYDHYFQWFAQAPQHL
ncbi:MAG: hypothetical protein AAF715_11750 [Myxococcota bacterium]